jgi:hypothetical protein
MSAAKKVLANVPPSVSSIGTSFVKNSVGALGGSSATDSTNNIAILPVQCARRVLFREAQMTADEMHGLAFRLQVIGTNGAVSAVVVAPDQYQNGRVSALNYLDPVLKERSNLDFPLNPFKVHDCLTGMDHLQVRAKKINEPNQQDELRYLLNGASELVKACNQMKKSPIVTVTNGLVADSGYALCMGRYVVATENTRFAITTPYKGLTLDPVGLSYTLNRLGRDYKQPCAPHAHAMGNILALTGFTANGGDMVATGLATHYGSWGALDLAHLEETLGNIPPYEEQTQWSKERSHYQPLPFFRGRFATGRIAANRHKQGRNAPPPFLPENRLSDAAVANALDTITDGNVLGGGLFTAMTSADLHLAEDLDTSLDTFGETFAKIFERDSIEGMLDGLAQAKNLEGADADYKAAAELLHTGMKAQSPLALLVTHRLMTMGRSTIKGEGQTLEKCMARERKAQQQMFMGQDYKNWADAQLKGEPGKFAWKHKSVGEITKQEVDDILEVEKE